MRANLSNRVGGGVDGHHNVAVHGQIAVTAESGVAGHGGLRAGGIVIAVHDAAAQSAGRPGLRQAVNRIRGIHLHGTGAALAFAHLERRGKRAGSVRIHHQQADVDIGDALRRQVDARIGIGFRFGEHVDAAGHNQHGAAHLGDGSRRNGRVRLAGFAANERDVRAAAGAHLRRRSVVVGRATDSAGVEAGLDLHASRLNRRALDLRLLRARNRSRDDVDRHVHSAGREVLTLNVRRRLRVARHGDGHSAGACINHAASVDSGAGADIRPGIGDVFLDADAAKADALAGLRGNRIGICRVFIAHGNARSCYIAGDQSIEAALRIGVQGIDTDADGVDCEILAADQRIRIGIADHLDIQRVVDLQRGSDDLGVVGGVRRSHCHVRLRSRPGERSAAAAAVRSQNSGRALLQIFIQLGRDRDAARLQRDRLDIRLLARLQRRRHGIGCHVRDSGGHGGLVHRRLSQRSADRLDLHRTGAQRARAREVRIDIGRVLRNGHVHLDVVLRDVHAARRWRQLRYGQAGGIRLHGHLANLALPCERGVVRHDHVGIKAALSVGICRAQRCGNPADPAHVGDLRHRVGIALGQDVDSTGRQNGSRTQARIGLGTGVGHGDVDARADQRAAAGIQRSLGALRGGVVRVEIGFRRDRASRHVAVRQGRFLTGAEHRRGKRRVHAHSADIHALDRRVSQRLAISQNRQAHRRVQLTAADDIRQIPRVVVRNGGVHAHSDQTRRARDRVRSGLGRVVQVIRSRVYADRRRADHSALGVNQRLIARTQVDIAHGEADARCADRR